MNLRDHGNAGPFLIRLFEGISLVFGCLCCLATVLFWLAALANRVDIKTLIVSILIGLVVLTPGVAAIRYGIFTRSPDLRSSTEALWIKVGWSWRKLACSSIMAFEGPHHLQICTNQLPSGYIGTGYGQTDDHRKWQSFVVSDQVLGYDSLIANLRAAEVPIKPW